MQRISVCKFIITIVVLALVSLSTFSIELLRARPDQHIVLQSQIAPLVRYAHSLWAANGAQELNLWIGLQPRNQQQLDSLFNDLYVPGSSSYYLFITRHAFAARFAPTRQDEQQV